MNNKKSKLERLTQGGKCHRAPDIGKVCSILMMLLWSTHNNAFLIQITKQIQTQCTVVTGNVTSPGTGERFHSGKSRTPDKLIPY